MTILSNIGNLYTEILNKSFADANSENAGLTSLVSNVNSLVAQGGRTFDIPTLGNVTISTITDGTDITEATPTFGKLTLSVADYALNLPVSYFAATSSEVELYNNIGRKGAEALVSAKEAAIVAAGITATNNVTLGVVGTSVTSAKFEAVNLYFRGKSNTSPIWMVVSPAQFDALVTAHQTIGNNVTTLGNLLNERAPSFAGSARYVSLAGVNVIDSTHITTTAGFAFVDGGLHFGERANSIRTDWSIAKGQTVAQIKSTFGAGAVNNDKATKVTFSA